MGRVHCALRIRRADETLCSASRWMTMTQHETSYNMVVDTITALHTASMSSLSACSSFGGHCYVIRRRRGRGTSHTVWNEINNERGNNYYAIKTLQLHCYHYWEGVYCTNRCL